MKINNNKQARIKIHTISLKKLINDKQTKNKRINNLFTKIKKLKINKKITKL